MKLIDLLSELGMVPAVQALDANERKDVTPALHVAVPAEVLERYDDVTTEMRLVGRELIVETFGFAHVGRVAIYFHSRRRVDFDQARDLVARPAVAPPRPLTLQELAGPTADHEVLL